MNNVKMVTNMVKKSKKIRKGYLNHNSRMILVILSVAAIGAVLLGTSLAAPRSSSKSKYMLTIPDGLYGQTTVATLSGGTFADAWITATCYQNGSSVIFNRVALDQNNQATLQLGPTDGFISGTSADCNADAKNWNVRRQRWEPLASTTFRVLP